jgi:hypothetical protein
MEVSLVYEILHGFELRTELGEGAKGESGEWFGSEPLDLCGGSTREIAEGRQDYSAPCPLSASEPATCEWLGRCSCCGYAS